MVACGWFGFDPGVSDDSEIPGRFGSDAHGKGGRVGVVTKEIRPTGHLQVRGDARGRSYFACWRDAEGPHRKKLGPAHVRDSGRRTVRGAVVWRAGEGPKPTPEHLVPKEARDRLDEILRDAPRCRMEPVPERTLHEAVDGQLTERRKRRGLKRSTSDDYGDLWERVFRDVGEDTPLIELLEFDWSAYFDEFKAQRVMGKAKAMDAGKAGVEVRSVAVWRWTAQPAESVGIEVATKGEAVQLARELCGTWKHRRKGVYRVTPGGAQRPRRVSRAEATRLEAQGWVIVRRQTRRWMVCTPAAPQTINKYRDLLSAVFAWAVRQGWVDRNPIDLVPRVSRRADRQRVLRRSDFYDRDEVGRLLAEVSDEFERAFFLCGFHEGLRLPGEALGLTWGAVDFDARAIRPYDNWVRNASDTTKTANFAPIPMTTETYDALWALSQRGYRTSEDDHVFTRDGEGRPASEKELRRSFKRAVAAARLKPIPMYNARHSFGTALARRGIPLRTIQALMRHERQETTQQYMAYSPQDDLAEQMDAALSLTVALDASPPDSDPVSSLFERIDEEVPAKWAREMRRICEEMGMAAVIATADTKATRHLPELRASC
jgi:integrase